MRTDTAELPLLLEPGVGGLFTPVDELVVDDDVVLPVCCVVLLLPEDGDAPGVPPVTELFEPLSGGGGPVPSPPPPEEPDGGPVFVLPFPPVNVVVDVDELAV